jgi:eukaryotic-like serine/threonine-protein kinase
MVGPEWKVGNYIVDDPTGFARGTFGTLYVARRISDGRKVAMKLVLLTNDADGRERLAAERHGAILQQQFEKAHGMVPEVYEYGPHREHLYIAMEFVEGRSLSELIKEGLAPTEAARYAAGICEFLDRAHQFATSVEGVPYHRIVHADLKPDHVLIARSGEMKVLDFGIAKALEKTTEVTTNNWSTVAYASPERLQSGGHVNVHADFWSLGVMLYEMISGHLPYPALTARHLRSQLEQAIRTNARPEPLPESCPPELTAIVRKLMAHQVEHRYPTASAIRADLQRFLEGNAPAALAQYETAPTVPVQRERSTIPIAAPSARIVLPTEPFPIAASASAAAGVAAVDAVATKLPRTSALVSARRLLRRLPLVAILLGIIGTFASEGGAWVAAERFRAGIDGIDAATLVQKRHEYDGIRSWGPFHTGLRLRVNGLLRRRLVELADGVIADYRRDDPTMTAADWRQATAAIKWALELSPRDSQLRAKQFICDAHLARVAARTQRRGTDAARQAYQLAIERFQAAAKLDDRSFDPYLGISNIESYGLDEVDQAAIAIEEAEKRGFKSGRRERAQLGDGYLRRADRSRRRARGLDDEQERRLELEKARSDYARCVERFEAIRDFGNAAANLAYCRAHMYRVATELDFDIDPDARWLQ